ncbi:hypothetical protein EK21DRAFT_106068 [Setomelanomma holmii]|uniref:Uncharacterized protein n=1 Tax=Setomelanomma holmii TaxID=210430 RepID=A0A9P4HPL4_9PLEO|nr:hypothetical protein EK21DRAFT_106068 [Setomelanomma holmii]
MDLVSTAVVQIELPSDEEPPLPKKAAFLMAMGHLEFAIKESERLDNDLACTAEQREDVELTVKEKLLDAWEAHPDATEEDLSSQENDLEAVDETMETLHKRTEILRVDYKASTDT